MADPSSVEKIVAAHGSMQEYAPFFDRAWFNVMMKAAEGSKLEQIVFDFLITCKGAENVSCMPYVMVKTLAGYATGQKDFPDFGKDLACAMRDKVLYHLGKEITLEIAEKIDAAVHKVYDETIAAFMAAPMHFDENAFWQVMGGSEDYRLSIWAAQRLCYAGIYFAYEEFVLKCYRIAVKNPSFRIKKPDQFGDLLASATTDALRDQCWTDKKIKVARLARHVIAHAGGRESNELRKLGHHFEVKGGEIQVMVTHTRELQKLLQEPALKLVEHLAPKHPKCSTNP